MQQSSQKKGESHVADETSEQAWRSAQVAHRPLHLPLQYVGIRHLAVGQGLLRVPPDPFVGIEFRGVGGQGNDVQATAIPLPQLLHLYSAMDPGVVPEEEDVSAQVAQQMPDERGHVGAPEVGLLEAEVKSYPFLLGTDRHRRDRRDLLPAEGVPAHRGYSPGRPRLAHRGDQEEAGFVGEGKMGTQPRGVFFTRGHSSATHFRMASSSRSAARRAGLWWVHPSLAINRPMWSGWYLPRHSRAITSAIRFVVQISVRYPWATAPLRSRDPRRFTFRSESLGGRPGENRTAKDSSPRFSYSSRQRITELAWHPTRRATSWRENPSSSRDRDLRRRSAIRSGEPLGRIMDILLGYPLLHYLRRSQ